MSQQNSLIDTKGIRSMKAFILTDLEGISGLNGRPDGVGNKIINEEVCARLLTQEVNAVAEGLIAGGATEVRCHDGHGGSNSILIESLCPRVHLYQYGGVLDPLLPLDGSFAAAIQIGAHAMNGVADGFMNHTFNSHAVVGMWLNAEPIGEVGISVLLAAGLGIATILVSGDRAACREAKAFVGRVETVETKVGIHRYSAVNRPLLEVRAELRSTAERAMRAAAHFPIIARKGPFELKVELMDSTLADRAEKAGAERVNAVTVVYAGDDLWDVFARRSGWGPGVYRRRFP